MNIAVLEDYSFFFFGGGQQNSRGILELINAPFESNLIILAVQQCNKKLVDWIKRYWW